MKKAIFCLFTFLVISPVLLATEKKLTGEVLYSFEEPHFLLQSGDYIFRIKRDRINFSNQKALEATGSHVSVTIPLESIDLAWKSWDSEEFKKYVLVQSKELPLQTLFSRDGSNLQITGKVLPPMEKSFSVIQVGDLFIRVKKGKAAVNRSIASKEDTVTLKIPPSAIDFAWISQIKSEVKPTSQNVNPIEEPSIQALDGYILVKGHMLHSFHEDILIQSDGRIFQIDRDALSPFQLKKMKEDSGHVSVAVPFEGVVFSWKVYADDEIRKPELPAD